MKRNTFWLHSLKVCLTTWKIFKTYQFPIFKAPNETCLTLMRFGWWMQIVIVSNEDETREFVREVGEEVLPEMYGGRAKLEAIQDVELPPLENGTTN